MSIDNTLTAVYTGPTLNVVSNNIIRVPLPAGTITGVRIKLIGSGGSAIAVSDAVVFNLALDGTELFTNELTVPAADDEIDATGLSEVTTNDSFASLNINAPFVSGSLDDVVAIGLHITFADVSVQLTGAQTVAGVKTFTSDPIIPDEAYGAGWNGVLEPPTKNAVYDKIETISAGGVDTANSPNANEYARFTDADTIEGRTESEFKADFNLEIGTDVQAWDADLDTWATLTPSANAQSLVTAADYAAMKALLDLEIGTDVQAYDVELAALAGLTSAADKIPYFTGSGTAGLVTVGANLTFSGGTLAATGGGGGAGTFNIDDGTAAAAGNFTFDDGDATN